MGASELMMRFPDAVSDGRGTFRAQAMARQSGDGSWEAWLEFVPVGQDNSTVHVTPIETHELDRPMMEQWVSGLTLAYAEGALSRARVQRRIANASQLLFSLEELVDALDRRIPQVERIGEAEVTADAHRLRACAMQRIALLRLRNADA